MRVLMGMLLVGLFLVSMGTVWGQIVDGCDLATCRLNANVTPVTLFVCPQGDTPSFADQGWSLDIWVRDINGNPIPNIPAEDFWLIDCDPAGEAALCGGSASSNADADTDANGKTTMSLGTLVGGGCADGMALVVQGVVILDSLTNCTTPRCFPILLRSPDINGDLDVDLTDLSLFAASFPPQPYERCCDMDADGDVQLVDLALFAMHFGPPGHICL